MPAIPAGKLARIIRRAGRGRTDHRKRLVGVDPENLVIAVRADVADPQRGVGSNLLLDPEGPGNQVGVCRFGCTPPGTNFAVAGTEVVSGSADTGTFGRL